MERRKSQRQHIQVDIEIAHPGFTRCFGVAENISRSGICVRLSKGELPDSQRSVILNFKIWTGIENLYRRLYARVVRRDKQTIAFEFAEQDSVAQAVIQDLLFYQRRRLLERRCQAAASSARRHPAGIR